MRFSVVLSAFLLLAMAAITSCKEKNPEQIVDEIVDEVDTPTKVAIHFNPLWENQDFLMESVYHDNFGNRIRVDKFMQYMSSLTLVNESGDDVVLKDFHLMDFMVDNSFEFEVPPGNYKEIKFGIGVPEADNKDQDPSQYANSHPLSVAGSQGMFWTWNTGYIFLKFEGKVDTTGVEGNELLWPVAIHIGDDPYYARYNSPTLVIEVIQGETKTINVNIQVDQILASGGSDDIDFATDMITHTSNNVQLAQAFMINYINSITIEQ